MEHISTPAALMPGCCLAKEATVNNTPSSFYKFPELPNSIFNQSSGAHSPSYSMGKKILSRGYSGRGSEYEHSPQSSAEVWQEKIYTPTDGVGRDSFIFTCVFSQQMYQTYYFI